MKLNWIDILKSKLDQREFKASPKDWNAMESLLDQSFPVGSASLSSALSWKTYMIRFGLFISLLVIPGNNSEYYSSKSAAVTAFNPSLLEKTIELDSEEQRLNINSTEQLERDVEEQRLNVSSTEQLQLDVEEQRLNVNSTEQLKSKEAIGTSAATIVSSSTTKELKENEITDAQRNSTKQSLQSDAQASTNAMAASSASRSSNQKVRTDHSSIEEVNETIEALPILESQQALLLNSKDLFSTSHFIAKPMAPIQIASPDLFYSSKNRSFWNGWNSLHLQVLTDFNSTSDIGLSMERDIWGGRFGLGIGFGQTSFDYSYATSEMRLELTEVDFWNVETTTEVQIDSTWKILGLQSGEWQVDTFYNVRLDSTLLTRTDSLWSEDSKIKQTALSARFIEVPFYFEKAWSKSRWSLIAGIGGGIGWVNLPGNNQDLGIKSQDFIRINTELRLGTDYAFHPNWKLGIRYRPRYVWYSDNQYESHLQLNTVSLGLKFYLP